MVCAFVTNQLLHDQTSSSPDGAYDSAADTGLVRSLVDALYSVDSYKQSTLRVIVSLHLVRLTASAALLIWVRLSMTVTSYRH